MAQMVIICLGHSVHNFHREFSGVTEGGGGFVGFGGVLHRSGLTEHWHAGCTGAVSSISTSESEEDA